MPMNTLGNRLTIRAMSERRRTGEANHQAILIRKGRLHLYILWQGQQFRDLSCREALPCSGLLDFRVETALSALVYQKIDGIVEASKLTFLLGDPSRPIFVQVVTVFDSPFGEGVFLLVRENKGSFVVFKAPRQQKSEQD